MGSLFVACEAWLRLDWVRRGVVALLSLDRVGWLAAALVARGEQEARTACARGSWFGTEVTRRLQQQQHSLLESLVSDGLPRWRVACVSSGSTSRGKDQRLGLAHRDVGTNHERLQHTHGLGR